jgi:N-acetylglucosaminyldiphosphoundecaprenol N-acetyl-beta-D-mannosaminyltransferase
MSRPSVLDFPVDPIDVPAALDRVAAACAGGDPLQIITINAEMTMQARTDPALGDVLRRAGLVLPDGSGVVWALRRRGWPVHKLPGVEFVEHVAAWAAREGKRVFLFGGAEGVADRAAEVLRRRHAGLIVAGTCSGYFRPDEEGRVCDLIRAATPDILFVALGVPRQELWIDRHQASLGIPVAMGVGGSFDVLADRVKRAPLAMRRMNLEWLFRLWQEPWRWRRMGATLPKFAVLVLREK